MTVAVVLDFPEGTQQQYEAVSEHISPQAFAGAGGRTHVAGPHARGWRVINVWDSFERFGRFEEDQVRPHAQAAGLALPDIQMFEVDDEMTDDGRAPRFAQVVLLPGLDRPAFRATHDDVVLGNARPEGVTFHVNGPVEGGWCVIDAWTSKEIRDAFMERTGAILGRAPMSGPPTIEELTVVGTMAGRVAAGTQQI